eukprot:SAG22_NODE_805_length_7096_cov_28.481206_9_plen_60_part_00
MDTFNSLLADVKLTWLLSDNKQGTKYEAFEGDEFNIRLIQSCYDEVIGPVFASSLDYSR